MQSSSCFKKKPKKIRPDSYENSCEPNQFWLNESSIKDVGNEAHSGTHASVLNAETEYGIGVSTNIRNVILDKVEKQLSTANTKIKELEKATTNEKTN